MNVVILSPVRLFGEGLAACLETRDDVCVAGVSTDFAALRGLLNAETCVALIDVTQGYAADEVRALAAERPALRLIALGLKEQRQEVIDCGRSGFCDYVTRDATVEALVERMRHALAGRLSCSAEIASALMRGLFRAYAAEPSDVELTSRQSQVARLLERGMSNKEMARELDISLGT